MNLVSTVSFSGKSGHSYIFDVVPIDSKFTKADGAIYAVTNRHLNEDEDYEHDVIYIGQTADLSTEFSHSKMKDFIEANANVICLVMESDETVRQKALKDYYKPRYS